MELPKQVMSDMIGVVLTHLREVHGFQASDEQIVTALTSANIRLSMMIDSLAMQYAVDHPRVIREELAAAERWRKLYGAGN